MSNFYWLQDDTTLEYAEIVHCQTCGNWHSKHFNCGVTAGNEQGYLYQFIPQQGWICPLCGRVYSPTTMMCYYCGNYETTISSGRTDDSEEKEVSDK